MTATYSWDSVRVSKMKTKVTAEMKTAKVIIDEARAAKKQVEESRARLEQKQERLKRMYRKAQPATPQPLIEEGTRVVLSDETDYEEGPSNPKENGPNACIGTVEFIGEDDDHIEVAWDNGEGNNYIFDDLIPIESSFKSWSPAGRYRGKAEPKEEYTGKFPIGTMVYLLPGFYGSLKNNPCLGGKQQCIGEVVSANQHTEKKKTYHHIRVGWANGSQNSYSFVDEPGKVHLVEVSDTATLKPLLENDPNLSFRTRVNRGLGLGRAVADNLKILLGEV